MNSAELRELYLSFFEEKNHLRMSSSSLLPVGDPTLLLTSAGMVPFKPYFTGEALPPNSRMTSCQKCFRTSDVEAVGDTKHLTFFEMLGNFSIGDYFKEDAITWAWQFVTQRLSIPEDHLWVTVYSDDDEAFRYWRDKIGIPEERIYRYGRSDNWWGPAGSEGPCGPCSEIHYDFGQEWGCGVLAAPHEAGEYINREVGCHPNCSRCGRFSELWNLVFMQYYSHPDGVLMDLPNPNIDTGMGLERTLAVLQGKHTVYETDIFHELVATVVELTGQPYGAGVDTDEAIRVVAEHSRAITFLIADGVVPSNEGRGYVLRRIIRRAIRYGSRLGLQHAFLGRMAKSVIDQMGPIYPELNGNYEFILRTIDLEAMRSARASEAGYAILKDSLISAREEERRLFNAFEVAVKEALNQRNISEGSGHIQDAMDHYDRGRPSDLLRIGDREAIGEALIPARQILEGLRLVILHRDWSQSSKEDFQIAISAEVEQLSSAIDYFTGHLSGFEVFVLHDTYGFPPELTQDIAAEYGLTVDMEAFDREMQVQRDRARGAHQFDIDVERKRGYDGIGLKTTPFVGYQTLTHSTEVVGLLVEGELVSQVGTGQRVEVVLKETPFYAEGGGQIGDGGEIVGRTSSITLEDTQRPVGDLVVHSGVVSKGIVQVGDIVEARVEPGRRLRVGRNHTATHLLHAALREVLGTHVRQAGSLVTPDRLRFDFTSVNPMSSQEIQSVEELVNQKIRENLDIHNRETSYALAVQEGAIAFFGERYADNIRVVEMGGQHPFSSEVCGGTHLHRTGQVGLFLIISESSIGSGIRRIEALTGQEAEAFVRQKMNILMRMVELFQTTQGDLEGRARVTLEQLEQARRRTNHLERQIMRESTDALLQNTREINGVKVLVAEVDAVSSDALRQSGDWLREELVSGIVVLGAIIDGRPNLVAMVTADLARKGFHAGTIVSDAAKVMGGGGGGRPQLAQAGGRKPEKLQEALSAIHKIVGGYRDLQG